MGKLIILGNFYYYILSFGLGFFLAAVAFRTRSSPRSFQNDGEMHLARVARINFKAPDYHLMNHITLQMEDGTTQIDHILISRFGVFVIETKNYKGWIVADPRQANWVQVLFKARFKFQNPIFQNFRHVIAVRNLLDFLPPDAVKSVVVFTGEAKFKTKIPEGVFDIDGFVRYIRDQAVEVMSINRLHFCVGRLEATRLAISAETDVEHVENLRRRFGDIKQK